MQRRYEILALLLFHSRILTLLQNPEWRSKIKKDPGIPNLFPYKDKLLAEIEEKKRLKEEDQVRRREEARARKLEKGKEAASANDEDDMDDLEDGEDMIDYEASDDDAMDEVCASPVFRGSFFSHNPRVTLRTPWLLSSRQPEPAPPSSKQSTRMKRWMRMTTVGPQLAMMEVQHPQRARIPREKRLTRSSSRWLSPQTLSYMFWTPGIPKAQGQKKWRDRSCLLRPISV